MTQEFDAIVDVDVDVEFEAGDDGGEEFALVQEVEPELALPVWEPTGDAAVDAALDELALLDGLPIAEHIDVFTSVHAALHERLGGLEA